MCDSSKNPAARPPCKTSMIECHLQDVTLWIGFHCTDQLSALAMGIASSLRLAQLFPACRCRHCPGMRSGHGSRSGLPLLGLALLLCQSLETQHQWMPSVKGPIPMSWCLLWSQCLCPGCSVVPGGVIKPSFQSCKGQSQALRRPVLSISNYSLVRSLQFIPGADGTTGLHATGSPKSQEGRNYSFHDSRDTQQRGCPSNASPPPGPPCAGRGFASQPHGDMAAGLRAVWAFPQARLPTSPPPHPAKQCPRLRGVTRFLHHGRPPFLWKQGKCHHLQEETSRLPRGSQKGGGGEGVAHK